MQAKRMNPKPVITPDIQQMPLHALVWHPDISQVRRLRMASYRSFSRNGEAQQGKFRPAVGGAFPSSWLKEAFRLDCSEGRAGSGPGLSSAGYGPELRTPNSAWPTA